MSEEMYGVVKGVALCNLERTFELSDRMYKRNVPPHTLQPQFGIRPVPTKYATMPILDQRTIPTVPIDKTPPYTVSNQFNPGDRQSPWNGFAANVNQESKLKNMFFALQNCEQGDYIPSSDSDMYKHRVPDSNRVENPFHYLSQPQHFDNFNPNTCNIGQNFFNNATRVQRVDAILEVQGEVGAYEKQHPGSITKVEAHDYESNIE
jgi:hypothetical protein